MENDALLMPANARAILIEALRDAHRWLDVLLSDPRLTLESLASREGKSERSIRMTLSLAFLAPEIVKAAVEGRRPRGFGLKRLVDLPMAWPDQWRMLELQGTGAASPGNNSPCQCLPGEGAIHPFGPDQVSRFDPSTFEIGRGGHVANRANGRPGNGNLPPETFGKTRQELP